MDLQHAPSRAELKLPGVTTKVHIPGESGSGGTDQLLTGPPLWRRANEVGHSPLASSGLVLLNRGTKLGLFRTREDLEVFGVEVEAELKI